MAFKYRNIRTLNFVLERRKQQFVSLMNELVKKEEIVSFNVSTTKESKGTHVFYEIYLKKDIYTTVVVDFEGTFRRKDLKYSHRFDIINFLPLFDFKQAKQKIQEKIQHLKESHNKGMEHESRFESVLKSEKKHPHSLIKYVMKGKGISDQNGKDVYVGYRCHIRNYMVPIQIKSSHKLQKHHMRKYPKVPSIVIKDKMTDEDIVKKVLEICENYIRFPKRIILHL